MRVYSYSRNVGNNLKSIEMSLNYESNNLNYGEMGEQVITSVTFVYSHL